MDASILIAEDDADIRDLLRLYLEGEGFRVLEAGDGAAALRIAREQSPSMAIVDIMMPEMNGFELTRALRKYSDIPILILSAKSQDNDKILGLNLGAELGNLGVEPRNIRAEGLSSLAAGNRLLAKGLHRLGYLIEKIVDFIDVIPLLEPHGLEGMLSDIFRRQQSHKSYTSLWA